MPGTRSKVVIPYKESHRETNGILEKLCNKCFDWFELNSDNFYKNPKSPDGYFPSCKECERKRSANYKKENPIIVYL